jgi:DNA polymerase III gamma/tau subunit
MTDELYKRYRPTEFAEVVDQADTVNLLQKMLAVGNAVPHSIIFSGGSGVGKTTLARILAAKLECGRADLVELNAASARGVDDIRGIERMMRMGPVQGKCRVWIIDEAHKLTSDAQNAFLKPLEDTPGHVYFILCTTDPGKLLKTVTGRCTEIKLKEVGTEAIKKLVMRVARAEAIPITAEALARLAAVAGGSARKALVILNALIGVEDEDEQLATIASGDFKTAGIELARALMGGKAWREVAAILKGIDFDKEDVEGLRHMVMGYGMAVLMNGATNQKAANMVYHFSKHFYDSKKPGLVLACYDCCHAK